MYIVCPTWPTSCYHGGIWALIVPMHIHTIDCSYCGLFVLTLVFVPCVRLHSRWHGYVSRCAGYKHELHVLQWQLFTLLRVLYEYDLHLYGFLLCGSCFYETRMSKHIVLLIYTRDSRKSRQKLVKNIAHFRENRKNHGKIKAVYIAANLLKLMVSNSR